MTTNGKKCGQPHPVAELNWTCALPKGHQGSHKADPPTVTPDEIMADLMRGEPIDQKLFWAALMEGMGTLPQSGGDDLVDTQPPTL